MQVWVFFSKGAQAGKCKEDKTKKERECNEGSMYRLVQEIAEFRQSRAKEKKNGLVYLGNAPSVKIDLINL